MAKCFQQCCLPPSLRGYDRIVGALANLGHRLSDQTVGNLLRRHGISPAPKRKQNVSWKDFIRSHRDVLVGMDFFTAEVLTLKGLLTYYVLFFIHLETRQVSLAGFTPYPDQQWMEQQARNMTMEEWGCLRGCRYLLHDRDNLQLGCSSPKLQPRPETGSRREYDYRLGTARRP
jgi:putative transposase